MPTVHLIVKGKVQGVFYRATAKDIAEQLGVTGWIKNTWDGDVEAIVSGNKKAVQEFVEWCRHGPRKAAVSELIVTEKEETFFDNFSVIR